MPPRAASRLNVVVIAEAGALPSPAEVLRELGAAAFTVGGERELRGESAPAERFFSSGQGGFRVVCPAGGGSVVEPFWRALEAWRRGGPRSMRCGCGAVHDLGALTYAPPAAFGAQWIEARDAASTELTAEASAVLARRWPGHRVVGSRG